MTALKILLIMMILTQRMNNKRITHEPDESPCNQELQMAFEDQQTIGFDSFVLGMFSKKWAAV